MLTVTQSRVPPGSSVIDPSIARPQLRCLEQYHLNLGQSMTPMVLEHVRMPECRERLQQVLEVVDDEMHSLYQQLPGSDYAVLFTSVRGVILNCVNAGAQCQTFEHAGLWLGADWGEPCEGTNGVDTCAAERQALIVQQEEHFRSRHIGLTCPANPMFGPQGRLTAVPNVSSACQEISQQSQFYTTMLVNLLAKIIKDCYFLHRFEGSWLLRFRVQSDYVDLFSEGLLVFEGDGRIRVVNQSALNLFDCSRQCLSGQSVGTFLDCRFDNLLDRISSQPSASQLLRTREGRTLYVMLRSASQAIPQGPTVPPIAKPTPTAPGLCLDDTELAADFRRALKVYVRGVSLLLNGETGFDKKTSAKAMYLAGPHAEQTFAVLNHAVIPETLIESELFGYRDGSFTGAHEEGMCGKLQQVDGGILFLDEIGDMLLALQTHLLRMLEECRIVPLGGEPEDADVRLISATHRDLAELVADGRFCENLYYRLDGVVVSLPPSRERSDREELLDYLLVKEARDQRIQLNGEARQGLLAHRWPGNVRQMRTVLRILVALYEDGWIGLYDLPADIRQALAVLPPATMAPAPVADNSLGDAE